MDNIEQKLTARLGRVHARQRLGIEADHGHRIFGQGLNFFHPENWYSAHALIRFAIQMVGMYERGQRNARNLLVKKNLIHLPHLPKAFHNFKILHLTDLHVDMDDRNLNALIQTVADLDYDICVLTGSLQESSVTIKSHKKTMQTCCREFAVWRMGELGVSEEQNGVFSFGSLVLS